MDIKCPYCNEEININHDEGQGYTEDVTHQQVCDKCGKTFVFTSSVRYTYSPEKAPCLNGGEHEYKAVTACPIEFSNMRCIYCDEERKPTEAEYAEIIKSSGKQNIGKEKQDTPAYPKTLKELTLFFLPRFSGMEKKAIFLKGENAFAAFCHSQLSGGIGMHIRNELELWHEDSVWRKYFKSEFNLNHPDDISDLIIRCIFKEMSNAPK